MVIGDAMLRINHKPIVAYANAARLPAVYAARDYVDWGGLVSYGVCIPLIFDALPSSWTRFLKGRKRVNYRWSCPPLVVNVKNGVTVPQSIALSADEAIE